MSSDTTRIQVVAVEGRDVVLVMRPTTAAGLCEFARTRTFVLMELERRGGPVTLEQTLDIEWLRRHLDEYVSAVRIEKLQGITHESTLRSIAEDYQIPIEHLQPRVTLRATMASEALAEHFVVGSEEGSKSYDAWLDPLAAPLPSRVEDPPPYDPRSDPVGELTAAVPALMPRWKPGFLGFERQTSDATISIRFDTANHALRPGVEVHVSLLVPAFSALGGPGRGESPSMGLLFGEVLPRTTWFWFRQYEGAGDEPRESVTFTADARLEDPSSLHERFARTMDDPAVDELLTREGLIGAFEEALAARPAKDLPPNHARLGAGRAPALPGRWRWTWKPELLWQRIVLHAALGRREDARAALEQARARSKRPPKGLRALIASLDAEAGA